LSEPNRSFPQLNENHTRKQACIPSFAFLLMPTEQDTYRADETPYKTIPHVAVGMLRGGGSLGLKYTHTQQNLPQPCK